VDREDHETDLYRRASRQYTHPHPGRHLHTFVPLPSSSAIPSLVSHGGIPYGHQSRTKSSPLVDPQRSVSN
jgi:hypothetical protein